MATAAKSQRNASSPERCCTTAGGTNSTTGLTSKPSCCVLSLSRRPKLTCAFSNLTHRRVAIRAGRCSGIFRQQTDALEKGLKHKKIYTTGLSEVNRMGAPVCNMFAQMIEKRMSDICQALKVHAVHARRKTVKASDFHLFLKNQAAV